MIAPGVVVGRGAAFLISIPSAQAELGVLRAFLDEPEARGTGDLRAKAERLAVRLASPVRVAIFGLPGSGKTSLAAFMAGEAGIIEAMHGSGTVPLALAYAADVATVAGWWDGASKEFSGFNIAGALGEHPEYVELRLPNPILRHINFLDLPGIDDPEPQTEQLLWAKSRADLFIWCTNAHDAWNEVEGQLWSLIPSRLKRTSLLVVTHAGDDSATITLEDVLQRLRSSVLPHFRDLVMISTPDAIASAPAGKIRNAKAWASSGGSGLVGALLASAAQVRQADLDASRELLPAEERKRLAGTARQKAEKARAGPVASTSLSPFSTPSSPEMLTHRETAGPDASPPVPRPDDPVAYLAARLDQLLTLANKPFAFDPGQIVVAAKQITVDIDNSLAANDLLRGDASWVESEVTAACGLLDEIAAGDPDAAALDAATLLLQLSRDLAWAKKDNEATGNVA